MTGAVLLKATAVVGAADGAMVTMALIDPSVTNLIGAVVGAIVTIVMGWFAFKTALASLNKKVDVISAKTQVIEGHVNSEKTEAQGKIAALQQEVALLREIAADKKETAALLAQAVATQPLAVVLPVMPPVPVKGDAATLKQIERHTEDTANNTARTEATVQEIKEKQ